MIGALAQGFGQALYETANYDSSGQLTTGSFMDYAMPRAHHMPSLAEIKAADHVVPATTNPLGVKGVGEAGTTGSIAAIMNAIADAIPARAPSSTCRRRRRRCGGRCGATGRRIYFSRCGRSPRKRVGSRTAISAI